MQNRHYRAFACFMEKNNLLADLNQQAEEQNGNVTDIICSINKILILKFPSSIQLHKTVVNKSNKHYLKCSNNVSTNNVHEQNLIALELY